MLARDEQRGIAIVREHRHLAARDLYPGRGAAALDHELGAEHADGRGAGVDLERALRVRDHGVVAGAADELDADAGGGLFDHPNLGGRRVETNLGAVVESDEVGGARRRARGHVRRRDPGRSLGAQRNERDCGRAGDPARRDRDAPRPPAIEADVNASEQPLAAARVPAGREAAQLHAFLARVAPMADHRSSPIAAWAARSRRCTVETEQPSISAIDSSVSPSTSRNTHTSRSSLGSRSRLR